jgi:hypothetical protein
VSSPSRHSDRPLGSENADISLSCPQLVDIVDCREAKGADVGDLSELGLLEALKI